MASLYEIDESIQKLLDEETGEIVDFEAFEALQMERTEKIQGLALWIKDLKAEAEAYKQEKKSFEDRQKKAEKKADSVKRFLENVLDGQKFKTAKVECSFRRSTSVNVTDLSALPKQFLSYSEPTANKAEIKKALAAGEIVEGAELVENLSMTIK